MPRSRSMVRIASTPVPENCAGCVIALHGARSRRYVFPVSLLRSTVRWRKSPRRASRTCSATVSCGVAMNGSGSESITSRAVAPFWRASTKRPGTSIVRITFGVAVETLSSVTIVVLETGAMVGATGRANSGESAVAPFDATTSRRSPRRSSRCPKPSSASVPVTRPDAGSTTRSVRSVTAKIRRPSVLTMSGSSTPTSCTLVPENSGTDPPTSAPACGADTGIGALVAVSFDVCWRGGGAICGVTTASIIGGAARPSTPTPPWVRNAPERA